MRTRKGAALSWVAAIVKHDDAAGSLNMALARIRLSYPLLSIHSSMNVG